MRWRATLAATLAALALAGCGGPHPHVLRMASADPAGLEHDPAVAFFADRVDRLSGGRLRIALDERWGRDGTAHEDDLLRAVAHGVATLGWAHASSFDRVGVTSFEPLEAPMLVDREDVQAAVVRGPLAARMLAGVRERGLRGLAVLAGPLSRLVGPNKPVYGLDDLRGLMFGVHGSALADDAVRSLHGYPRPISYANVISFYTDITSSTGHRPAAMEDDLDSLFFDRYGGPCTSRVAECGTRGPWVTTNVVLWPRAAVLVANPRLLRALTAGERAWVTEAAIQAARYSTRQSGVDQRLMPELCAAGVRFTVASADAVESLQRAWRPIYAQLERTRDARAAVRAIERMRAREPPASALRVPPACTRRPNNPGVAHGVDSTLPDGVYRVQVTAADLRAAGANQVGDRAGTATLTLRGGRWRLIFTEPGRKVLNGTYAGTALRTAWVTAGRGRDEAYFSIAVARSGALRFHVVWADNRPFAEATYGSHTWRRIGP